MNWHDSAGCAVFQNLRILTWKHADEEMKFSIVHRLKSDVRGLILGSISFLYLYGCYFIRIIYFFNVTYLDFMPDTIFQANVRIPLVNPIEGNTRGKIENRYYRSFKRNSSFKFFMNKRWETKCSIRNSKPFSAV
jgi:hypothetical protein